ncbi:MAG: PKD domain-containing protein [Flavobacterium sp.]|nr:PKD domain-containing protein [Flavobacterium sp.]
MKTKFFIVVYLALALAACVKVINNSTSGTGSGGGGGSSNPSNPAPTPGQTPGTGTSTPTTPGGQTGSGGTSSGTIGTITIIYSSTAPCAPSNEVFTFTCSATGAPAGSSYAWYYGDGKTGTGLTSTNTYTNAGTYSVLVKVINNNQILGQSVLDINALGQSTTPVASFTAVAGATASTIIFTSTSTLAVGTIKNYVWDFGDGTIGSGGVNTHVYTQTTVAQLFSAKLTVSSAITACTATTTQTITIPAISGSGGGTITPPPGGSSGSGGISSGSIGNITIAFTTTAPCAPSNEIFTFNVIAPGAPSGSIYEWFFGDGNSSSGANTTNTYNTAGSYTVLVKVKNNNQILGQSTMAVTAIGQGVTPVASFYAQQTNAATTGNYYSFNSTSSLAKGSITSYVWDYNDGSNGTGSFSTHTYVQTSVQQLFTVKLTITSDAGCVSSRSQVITVPAGYSITGGFSYTSTSPCKPSSEMFTFTGPTNGVPAGAIYTWDFGDGIGGTGNPINKSYTFPNSYNVTLTITLNNSQLYKVLQPVTSFGQDVTPTASISVQQSNAAGSAWAFNSTSTVPHGTITSYAWDYGDGTTGVNAFNIKTYTQTTTAQTFIVKLTATSNANCTASATTSVIVPAK